MRFANTFQARTPIGAALQSLSQALFSGPSASDDALARARGGLISAQTERQQALIEGDRLKAEKERRRAGATQSIADLIANAPQVGTAGPNFDIRAPAQPGFTRPDLSSVALDLTSAGASFVDSPQDLANLFRFGVANTGGSDPEAFRALVGSGTTPGVNQAVSLGGQGDIRAANAKNDLNEALATQALQNAGALERSLASPFNTPAGATTRIPVGDGTFIEVRGRDTRSTAEGAAFNALPQGSQALAVGPSESQVNAQTVRTLSLDDQRTNALGAQAFGSPLERVANPDGTITLTPRADAAGQPGVPPAAASAADIRGPTTANRTQNNEIIRDAEVTFNLIDTARGLAADERNFGASGFFRSTVQDLRQQGSALAQTLGSMGANVQDNIVNTAADVQAEGNQPVDPSNFDPKLKMLQFVSNVLAYRLALTFNPDGRISDRDFRVARDTLGFAGALSNKKRFLAGLETFEVLAKNQVSAAQSSLQGSGVTSAPQAEQESQVPAPVLRFDAQGNRIQ